MVDEGLTGPGGTGPDGQAAEVTARDLTVDQPSGRGGRSAWLVVAAVLVVAVLGVATLLITRSSDDDLASASRLSLYEQPESHLMVAAGGTVDPSTYLPEYDLVGDLPDLGSAAMVKRLVAPELTLDEVQSWANTLGLSGEVQQSEGWFSLTDGVGSLAVQANGSSVFVGYNAMTGDIYPYSTGSDTPVTTGTTLAIPPGGFEPPSPPADLPDDAEAEAIARQLLDDLGVLEGDWTFSTDVGGVMAYSPTSCDGAGCDGQEHILSRTVVATPAGEGSTSPRFWNVSVGDAGRIEFLNGTMASVEDVGEYPIVSTSEAFQQLARHTATNLGFGSTTAMRSFAAVGSAIEGSESTEPGEGGSTVVEPALPSGGSAGETTTTTSVMSDDHTVSTASAEMPEAPPTDLPVPDVGVLSSVPVIEVTGVELGLAPMQGVLDGEEVTYLVPAYNFQGRHMVQGMAVDATTPAPDARAIEITTVASMLALDPGAIDLVAPGSGVSVGSTPAGPPESAVPAPVETIAPTVTGPDTPMHPTDPAKPATPVDPDAPTTTHPPQTTTTKVSGVSGQPGPTTTTVP